MSLLLWLVVQLLSGIRLFAAPWTVARQAPLSMGFPRLENTGVSCHLLPNSGIETADSLLSELPSDVHVLILVCAKLLQSCPTL